MRSILVAALGAALAASTAVAQPRPAPALAPVRAAAPLPSILVPADWLAANLRHPDVVVLHVAYTPGDSSYQQAHVPGARRLDLSTIARTIDGLATELPPEADVRAAFEALGVGDRSRVVLVGDPIPATRAWATLDWLGAGDRAAVLDGGLAAWRAAGHPVARDVPPAAPRGRLTTTARRDARVDADWIVGRLGDATVALVDARPTAEYTGEDTRNGRFLPGHVPGAEHLYWQRLLVSPTDPRLRPAEELRALFTAAGAAPGRTVVHYCMVGQRASVTYFVSRLLGYDSRFYDGSWDDWSKRKLPYVPGERPGSVAEAKP